MKTYTYTVTIPDIPDDWPEEKVRELTFYRLKHPYDAAYDASITVRRVGVPRGMEEVVEFANPERENNGCMAHKKGSPPS